MTQIMIWKKVSIYFVGSLLLLATILPTAVYAQGRSGNGNGNQPEKVEEVVNDRKAEAKQRVEEKRQARQVKSAERRQEACERRVSKVEDAMARLSTRADRHFNVIDSFYTKVQNFYDSGQLTVSNYDELNQDVADAKDAAETELAALSELEVDIDCTDPTVATSIGAFKDSANASKDALKDFRKTLVTLISSMRAEATEGDDAREEDTEGSGDESETENENETESENELENEEV